MIHVHVTTALQNNVYTGLLGIAPPDPAATLVASRLIGAAHQALSDLLAAFPILAEFGPCRSLVFFSTSASFRSLLREFVELPWVQALSARALDECREYVNNGVQFIEVENITAPYFIGAGSCAWEEIFVLYEVLRVLRCEFPSLGIGAHILSANEFEALPLAIAHGCCFVRSEASLFFGFRPEGTTNNHGNLARFMVMRQTLRNVLHSIAPSECGPSEALYPQLWSDVQKKHTVFPAELRDIHIWLHNIQFVKLEGIIVTGLETGSNVTEATLMAAREAIDAHVAKMRSGKLIPHPDCAHFTVPLITGSGLDFDLYVPYADFIICGTAFKEGAFWENKVDPARVKDIMSRVRTMQQQQQQQQQS